MFSMVLVGSGSSHFLYGSGYGSREIIRIHGSGSATLQIITLEHARQPVLWSEIHSIWIRMRNFGSNRIRIQGYVNNFFK